ERVDLSLIIRDAFLVILQSTVNGINAVVIESPNGLVFLHLGVARILLFLKCAENISAKHALVLGVALRIQCLDLLGICRRGRIILKLFVDLRAAFVPLLLRLQQLLELGIGGICLGELLPQTASGSLVICLL